MDRIQFVNGDVASIVANKQNLLTRNLHWLPQKSRNCCVYFTYYRIYKPGVSMHDNGEPCDAEALLQTRKGIRAKEYIKGQLMAYRYENPKEYGFLSWMFKFTDLEERKVDIGTFIDMFYDESVEMEEFMSATYSFCPNTTEIATAFANAASKCTGVANELLKRICGISRINGLAGDRTLHLNTKMKLVVLLLMLAKSSSIATKLAKSRRVLEFLIGIFDISNQRSMIDFTENDYVFPLCALATLNLLRIALCKKKYLKRLTKLCFWEKLEAWCRFINGFEESLSVYPTNDEYAMNLGLLVDQRHEEFRTELTKFGSEWVTKSAIEFATKCELPTEWITKSHTDAATKKELIGFVACFGRSFESEEFKEAGRITKLRDHVSVGRAEIGASLSQFVDLLLYCDNADLKMDIANRLLSEELIYFIVSQLLVSETERVVLEAAKYAVHRHIRMQFLELLVFYLKSPRFADEVKSYVLQARNLNILHKVSSLRVRGVSVLTQHIIVLLSKTSPCTAFEELDSFFERIANISPNFGQLSRRLFCDGIGCKLSDREINIKLCAKCKCARYCSIECQQEHWKKEHKYVCKKFAV